MLLFAAFSSLNTTFCEEFYYDKAHTEEVLVNTGKTYYAVFPVNRKGMISFKKK